MRYISLLLIGLISYIVQDQIFPSIFTRGWQPDLLLVWVIIVALTKGRKKAIIIAILAGITQDIIIGNLLGIHLISYLAVAYVASKYSVYEEQWYRSVIFVFLMSLFVNTPIVMILLYMKFPDMNVFMYIFNFVFPEIWLNAILGIAIHKIVWKLNHKDENFWE